ncbi:MAG: glycosyltransferase [Burkholderiaceae bacterium]
MSTVTVSIVAHGHGAEVLSLLEKMASDCTALVNQVILTLNIPDEPLRVKAAARPWPFRLDVIANAAPRGFGANHNAAFAQASEPFFCVLNPDVEIVADPFPALVQAASRGGIAYPRQVSRDGSPQAFARRVPTPADLLRRHLLRIVPPKPAHPDFVTGACMAFAARTYAALGGFDEKYFMYCEDVDICLRAQLSGHGLTPAPVDIVHEARQASRRRLRPMAWHVASLLRLWSSPVFRAWRGRAAA